MRCHIIDPKSVDSSPQPETQGLMHRGAHVWISPIQIRLLGKIGMVVILAGAFIPLHAQCAHPSRQERPARRVGLHRHPFAQDDAEAAKTQWRKLADQLRPALPKLAAFMDEAETNILAYMTFPKDHWQKIYSTNGLERVNG